MKYKYTILYTLFCILLFFIIMKWGKYIINNYVIENFDTTAYDLYREGDTNTPLTSHTVDLPINTTYQCKNFCGPQSQCSITREQCSTDVDCYGCQPIVTAPPKYITTNIRGENDAGRLIYNQNPQYSQLTTDIGTRASLYNKKSALVPKPYLGIDRWMKSAEFGMQLFNKNMNYRYLRDPSKIKNIPRYPIRESATGLFEDNGPLAANDYL